MNNRYNINIYTDDREKGKNIISNIVNIMTQFTTNSCPIKVDMIALRDQVYITIANNLLEIRFRIMPLNDGSRACRWNRAYIDKECLRNLRNGQEIVEKVIAPGWLPRNNERIGDSIIYF